jgi:hypothetical protein
MEPLMLKPFFRAAVCAALLIAPVAWAQNTSTDCSFDDGKQMSIRYNDVDSKKDAAKTGDVWAPGGKPMTLFTQTALTLGNSEIPAAAYTVYLIPGSDTWTLVVNKNVQEGAKYDQSQDVARVQMPKAELGDPVKKLKLTLAKMGGKQCNLRVYYGKVGTYGAEFKEK